MVSCVLSEFWSPEPTPLQGWESPPCSSRPTARGRGGLQLQTRTCRVGCTIAECPGPAGRQPWALLEREAAGSGGRRKLSCWQAPPLFHFPGGQADVIRWILPDLNGSSNRILAGDRDGGVQGGLHFYHFLPFSLFKSTLRSSNSFPDSVLACASLCKALHKQEMVTKRTEVTWQTASRMLLGFLQDGIETYLRGEGREGCFGQRLLPAWWLPASCSARSKNALPVSLFMNYPSPNRAAGAFCSPFFEYGWAFQFLVLHSLTHTVIKQRGIFCRISFMMQYLAASPPLRSHPWESSHSNTPKVVFNQQVLRLRHFFWGGGEGVQIWFLFQLKLVYSPQNKRMPTIWRSLALLRHQPELSCTLRNSTAWLQEARNREKSWWWSGPSVFHWSHSLFSWDHAGSQEYAETQCTSQLRASGARRDHQDENMDIVHAGLARKKAFSFKIMNAYGSRA